MYAQLTMELEGVELPSAWFVCSDWDIIAQDGASVGATEQEGVDKILVFFRRFFDVFFSRLSRTRIILFNSVNHNAWQLRKLFLYYEISILVYADERQYYHYHHFLQSCRPHLLP